MPTTPDRPAAGRPAGPDGPDGPDGHPAADPDGHPDAATEAAHGAARDTVPIDVRPRRPREGGGRAPVDNPGASGTESPTARSATPSADDSRPTVALTVGATRATGSARLPQQRGGPRAARRAPLVVAAGFATVWAALLSYAPVALVMWMARALEGVDGIAGALRTGLAAWLLGHGVPLGTGIGPLGLAPLLLTLLAGWRLNRAGVHVTRAVGARGSGSVRAVGVAAAAVGGCYGLLGVLAAMVVDAPGLTVSVPRAGLTFAAFGLVCALVGALRCTDALGVLARRAPAPVRHGLRTGLVAVLLVLAAGAGFTGLAIATGGGQAAEIIGAYRTGVAGQAGITLVSLGYGVNATIWAAAYLLGPGFLLGTGTTVRLTEVTVGPLPTVPLLAGLPDGPVGAAGAALLAVPVLAGMAAGWLLVRRLVRGPEPAAGRPATGAPQAGWRTVLGAAVLAGPAAGILLGALAWMSSGSLGNGRLAEIGPVPWHVAAVAAAVIAVSTTLGAAAARSFPARPAP